MYQQTLKTTELYKNRILHKVNHYTYLLTLIVLTEHEVLKNGT